MTLLPTITPDVASDHWAFASDDNRFDCATGADHFFPTDGVPLDNMPTDFESMDTLEISVEASLQDRVDDGATLLARVMTAGFGAVLAAATSGGARQTVGGWFDWTTSDTTRTVAFGFVDTTATKADWDGAIVELFHDHIPNMANDGAFYRVDYLFLDGTYTAAAGAGTTVTPAVVAATAGVPTPAVVVPGAANPATVPAAAAIPAPQPSVPASTSPVTVPTTTTVPTPAINAAALVTPSTVPAVVTVPTSQPAASSVVAPDPVAAVATVPTPEASAAPIVTPASVTVVVAVPGPDVTAAAVVTVSAVSAVATVPTPTVDAGAAETVTPDTVAAVATVAAPQAQAAAAVSPAAVPASVTIPQAVVEAAAAVAPAMVAAIATVPTPVVDVAEAVAVAPLAVAAVIAVPAPSVTGPATVSPAPVAVFVAVFTPTILGQLVTITRKQPCQFFRNTTGTRLVLMPLGRSQARGLRTADWERVSTIFVLNTGEENTVMGDMAAVWAADQGASRAVLEASINGRLQDLGYRGVGGANLT